MYALMLMHKVLVFPSAHLITSLLTLASRVKVGYTILIICSQYILCNFVVKLSDRTDYVNKTIKIPKRKFRYEQLFDTKCLK